MFERRSVDFKTISVPFTCAPSNVLCVAIVTSRSSMRLWRHCWRWQWLGRVHCTGWEWDLCQECPLQFTSYFVLFSSLFNIPCYKRANLVPALAYGSCRVSDQGTTLRASDLHNARPTILNPFIYDRNPYTWNTAMVPSMLLFFTIWYIFPLPLLWLHISHLSQSLHLVLHRTGHLPILCGVYCEGSPSRPRN